MTMTKLKWMVYRYNINRKSIEQFNIFNHCRFAEDVERDLKKCKTKEEFSEKLKSRLLYYFWCKAEYEVVVTSFPPRIKKDELDRLNSDYKEHTEKYGHAPCCLYTNSEVGEKVDIYSQVMMNFEHFINYVWSGKKGNCSESYSVAAVIDANMGNVEGFGRKISAVGIER